MAKNRAQRTKERQVATASGTKSPRAPKPKKPAKGLLFPEMLPANQAKLLRYAEEHATAKRRAAKADEDLGVVESLLLAEIDKAGIVANHEKKYVFEIDGVKFKVSPGKRRVSTEKKKGGEQAEAEEAS